MRRILADQRISIDAMVQKEPAEGEETVAEAVDEVARVVDASIDAIRESGTAPRNAPIAWFAPPRIVMNTTADLRSPPTSMSLTVMRPTSLTLNSRRMASPISRFKSSRTRWSRRDAMVA